MDPAQNGGIFSSSGDVPVNNGGFNMGGRNRRGGRPQASFNVGSGLGTGNEGRKRNGWVIAAGVFVVLAVIFAVAAIILVRQGNGGISAGGQNSSDYAANVAGLQDEYLGFATYMIYGEGYNVGGENAEDVSAELGKYDPLKDYAVTEAFSVADEGFLNTAKDRWDEFYKKFMINVEVLEETNETEEADETEESDGAEVNENEGKLSETEGIVEDVEYMNEILDFAVRYVGTEEWNEEQFLVLYSEKGFSGAEQEIDNHYKNMLETVYIDGKEYAEGLLSNAKATLKLYAVYDEMGCIMNGEIDVECLDEKFDAVKDAEAEYYEAVLDVDDATPIDVIDMISEYVFIIKDDFLEFVNGNLAEENE